MRGTTSSKSWRSRSRSRSLKRPTLSLKSWMASRTTALFGLARRSEACRRQPIVSASRVNVTLVLAIPLPYYHTRPDRTQSPDLQRFDARTLRTIGSVDPLGPTSWSPDGQTLAFRTQSSQTRSFDIWLLSVRDRKARPFLSRRAPPPPAAAIAADYSPGRKRFLIAAPIHCESPRRVVARR